MTNFLLKFKKITLSSIISLVIYIISNGLVTALMKESPYINIALTAYSIIFMAVFSLLLIYLLYIKDDSGTKLVISDYPNEYGGFFYDLKLVLKREINTIIAIFTINIGSWLLISIDKLIFSKRTFSALLLIYAPLNVIGVVLPDWLNSILAYVLGSIFCSAIYIFELILLRTKWYTRIKKQQN